MPAGPRHPVIRRASSKKFSPATSTRTARWAAAPGCCVSSQAFTPPRRSCTTIGRRSTWFRAISSSATTRRERAAKRSTPRPMPVARRAFITGHSSRIAAACPMSSTTTTKARNKTTAGGHRHAGARRETETFTQALPLGDGALCQRRRHAARLPRTLPCRYCRARAQDWRLRQSQPRGCARGCRPIDRALARGPAALEDRRHADRHQGHHRDRRHADRKRLAAVRRLSRGTRNPHDLRRTPGGSSSGSAAGVVAGMVSTALGTQVIGSTIRPASYCGCIGFKVSVGALNRGGSYDGLSQSATGVLATTLDDAWQVAYEIAARAGGDPGYPGLFGPASAPAPRKPRRLAFLETAGWAVASPHAKEAIADALARFKAAGIDVLTRQSHAQLAAVEAAIAPARPLSMRINGWEWRWPLNTYRERDASKLSRAMLTRLAEA